MLEIGRRPVLDVRIGYFVGGVRLVVDEVYPAGVLVGEGTLSILELLAD